VVATIVRLAGELILTSLVRRAPPATEQFAGGVQLVK
jgi:hypothetical protein